MVFDWIGYFGDSTMANWDGQEQFEPIEHPVRLHLQYDYDVKATTQTWEAYFNAWLATNEPAKTTGLVLGRWWHDTVDPGDIDFVLETIIDARERLPLLKALFVGDFTYEEWEISWITQGDYAPVLAAFPQLEYLVIRGGSELSFDAVQHQNLKALVIQTGGLAAQVVREIVAADLPALEHLELWLGSDYYGGDSTLADLQPILDAECFPNLEILGLRDCEYADDLAQALVNAPILEQIGCLDLSLGNLSDVGAEALFASQAIRCLNFLDLHHHYMSNDLLDCWATIGLNCDVSEQQVPQEHEGEEHRYAAVTE
ncbi:STM4015 family protein [Herpetosiphon gulosus]|uniref:Cytoplasmic protein n=1 Tax=Herpetosiphon gulosus TaxID=1973496 RepID=A0ABP9WY74_9CHLR